MASSNILLFDANKANMMSDEQYKTNTQRLNGVQSGIASSQLQNKTLYQVSLVAYAIAQIMNQNGLNANDTAAVSAFVSNLSGTILQKVADIATTQQAQAGVATGKWMSPALVKTAINTLAAKSQNILSTGTKTAFGLGSTAVPDDIFQILANAILYQSGNLSLPDGDAAPVYKKTDVLTTKTAQLFGKTSSAIPNDIFTILANAVLYNGSGFQTATGEDVPNVGIETGSATASGSGNTSTITFTKQPHFVILMSINSNFLYYIYPENTIVFGQWGTGVVASGTATWSNSNKTVVMEGSNRNVPTGTFNYLAII